MAKLRARALKPLMGKPWAREADFAALASPSYRSKEGLTVVLNAKIEDVQAVLAKALKPTRKLVTAVKFTGGKIEEVRETPNAAGEPVAKIPETPAKPVEAAVTVAKPTIGCPMPAFNEADIRASRVLETFLDPEQISDYRKTGAFVTVGADTGHRYLVANRERPNMLLKCKGRQLYDLEENRALCIHDWSVPPPEEMLALHLLLTLEGHENYVRGLKETYGETYN